MIKILILTQNEPFFIPKMIRHLDKYSNEDFKIGGVTILAPHRKNKNHFHWFRERSKIYKISELLIAVSLFLYTKINEIIKKKGIYSVRNYLKRNNIKEIESNDINNQEYICKVMENDIDVIISISCPQLFKKNLLESVKYCINAHGTLLPRHRGVFGSWWTLFSCDKIGGSTLHTMELKLDAGEILWQKEFTLEKNDTQYSIAYKTKNDMAMGLVETLKRINKNNVRIIEPKHQTCYHRAPTKEQGKKFHKKGYKVIGLNDIKNILSKEFS